MKQKICIVLVILCSVLILGACEKNSENTDFSRQNDNISQISDESSSSASKEIFAMDTYMTITAYGEKSQEAVDAAVMEIQRLDKLLSVGNSSSEVCQLNNSGNIKMSEDIKELMKTSKWIFENTDGAYDITIYPLMELWGFTKTQQAVPDQKDIDTILSCCGFEKLKIDNETLTLGKNQGIDFGGIAKGYTSARIMTIFKEYGINSGVVSLGGNVQCCGVKTDGSLWRCGITNPNAPDDTTNLLGVINVRDKAVITSGGYERFFEENGQTYHHIMNPKTGYPADSGLRSVTIVSENGTLADGLSTACFVMGRDRAVQFWKNNKDQFDMILMTDKNEIIITEGIKEAFSSDMNYEIVD